MLTKRFAVLCLMFFVVAFGRPAHAQWGVQSDSTVNRAVCDTTQACFPQGCTDGKNGAIIVWQDQRTGGSYGVFAQHLDSNGRELWPHNGISLCKNYTFNQTHPIICSDDSGGAYVVWQDARNVPSGKFGICIFGQHIKSDGTLLYPDTGAAVIIGKGDRKNIVIANDGRGGAFVACEDYRNSVSSSQPDIFGNRLWTRGVKSLIDTSRTGAVTTPWKSQPMFHDSAAHFHTNLIGNYLWLMVSGKYTRYQIAGITNDTQLTLNSYPKDANNMSYYIEGPIGLAIDSIKGKQTYPAIVGDGQGGCYIAWTSGATVPISVYATHLDSAARQTWNPSPAPGFLMFQGNGTGSLSQPNAAHVTLNRDGQQLLAAWEVNNPSSSSDTMDIYAARIRCSNATDTTQVWGQASDALSGMLYNQTYPMIFSDDSVTTGTGNPKGALILFENQSPSGADDLDVCMRRILGDGASARPTGGSSYNLAQQNHGQTGFQAVKIASDTSILAVWNDSRYFGTIDTCIFGQVIDKNGRKRYPTYNTTDRRAKPICHGNWVAKNVDIVPRTNGGIVLWTDYRKGQSSPAVYSQLVFKDASLPIELSRFDVSCRFRGQVDLRWSTASEQENAGFEVQRRAVVNGEADGDFVTVAGYEDQAALRGAGSSNTLRSYAWSDRNVPSGVYEYRLVEVALDGTRLAHDAKQVDARYGGAVESWSAGPNVPNPFAEQTVLPVSIPVAAVVDITVYNVAGERVATPISRQLLAAGMHEVMLERSLFPVSASGGLFARVMAFDPTTGALLWQTEKPVMMTAIH